MINNLTVPVLKKRLDVLLRTARFEGYDPNTQTSQCVACRRHFPISELQCGHFIKRGDQRLKYEANNVAPECVHCNKYLDGAQDKMAYWIIKNRGLDIFLYLVETDYLWIEKKLPTLKKTDFVNYYNFWLERTRSVESRYSLVLVPKTWKTI